MFGKGELVVYGRNGICEIVDITTMEIEGVPKDKLYYVLVPMKEKGRRIFTPVENKKIIIRRILTCEQALALIDEIPAIEELWICNDKLREATYKECMDSCDCREWIKIIKTMYLRNKERASQGKKITATDEKYLHFAENSLYSELSLALHMKEAEMEDYITKRIDELRSLN